VVSATIATERQAAVVRNPRPAVRRLLEVLGIDALIDIRDGD
jgi:anti-anti-sigma regulatory factor